MRGFDDDGLDEDEDDAFDDDGREDDEDEDEDEFEGDGAPGERDESVDDAIERVIAELPAVDRHEAGGAIEVRRGSVLFAVVAPGRLEVLLDPAIAAAALRTPDVVASTRGRGWVRFSPGSSRAALDVDRAEAWLRLAHRAAPGRS